MITSFGLIAASGLLGQEVVQQDVSAYLPITALRFLAWDADTYNASQREGHNKPDARTHKYKSEECFSYAQEPIHFATDRQDKSAEFFVIGVLVKPVGRFLI